MGSLSDFLAAKDFQEFTSSGTWTKPAGVTFVYVEAIGGGGGGANNTGGGNAGGASGGEYVSNIYEASALSATETVTVGAGGAGGVGFLVTPSDGSVGGDSSFGSIVAAVGGNAGVTVQSFAAVPRANLNPVTSSNGIALLVTTLVQSGYGDRPGSILGGGNTTFGGAGGGAGTGTTASLGGSSTFGGDGGDGFTTFETPGGDGSAPGGGGGGSARDGGGGAGGTGRVRVWSW